jgi:hypothetical protein
MVQTAKCNTSKPIATYGAEREPKNRKVETPAQRAVAKRPAVIHSRARLFARFAIAAIAATPYNRAADP